MKRITTLRPSPALVVALVALFAALSGTAMALHGRNSVNSGDIKRGQVKTSDLHAGAVTPPKTNVIKSASVTAAQATTAAAPVSLGGPTVTVKVPSGSLVAVYAEAQMNITGGGANEAHVHLNSAGIADNVQILAGGSAGFNTHYTAPGLADGVGTKARGGWLVFSVPAGTHTFTLTYSRAMGGTATFQNRKLSVAVLG